MYEVNFQSSATVLFPPCEASGTVVTVPVGLLEIVTMDEMVGISH